jgi:hypothetical protein
MQQITLAEAVAWLIAPKTIAEKRDADKVLRFLGIEKGKYVFLNIASGRIYHAYNSGKYLIVSRAGYQTGGIQKEAPIEHTRVDETAGYRKSLAPIVSMLEIRHGRVGAKTRGSKVRTGEWRQAIKVLPLDMVGARRGIIMPTI